MGRSRSPLVALLLAALASAFPADDTAVSEEVAQQLYAEALYAPVCPEVRSSPKLNLPDGAEVGGDGRGDEPVRWMLMPDGRGEAQVAVLSGAQPKDLPTLGDITFLLYTRDNPDRPERRAMNKTCLPTFENFKASRPTAVLIHGFGDNLQDSYMLPLLKDAFLERTDVNVLAVDWGRHAATPWYQTAAQATEAVGVHVAGLLDHMAERQGLSAARTHIVGFSLGAHVAGHTGKNVRSGRLHRITGLDPARVLFEGLGPAQRLDKTDADVVEVVHSSGGYLGFSQSLGHRDFFPNGGEWPQPGCVFDFISVCSHRRAYYYYAEALKESARFPAYPCASMEEYRAGKCARVAAAHLGDDADHCTDEGCTQGNFYFETNPSSPFARPEPSSSPTAESV
ncbi:inactive pancreatic lipase-related protein 1-like [Frankliniella occidentalis]|uniref:Inactive pancreatic lipase-related protein 1-like n=1 Tax=Frankliniella occidentalis TaxID=133901 RepID=A0A6J1SZN7_FRAOC|nr:inactive pancreatic lipase-related protein 1-like [Frankliniella occidentalis]